jgi:hypothetical protein
VSSAQSPAELASGRQQHHGDDRWQNEYTVRMKGTCSNLDRPAAHLVYRTWQNLACLQSGDIIGVTAPGLGLVTCSIAGVSAGAPAAQ